MGTMVANNYISELWRKKQTNVLRYLLRLRCWEYRQLPGIVRIKRPSRSDAAKRAGYKAKQGYVIYRVRVRRGNRKKPQPNGIVYGRPSNHGITLLKPKRNLRVVAEGRVGRRCGSLRLLNSYWINQDSTYKYFEVIMIEPFHKVTRHDCRINWICYPTHIHREMRGITCAGRHSRGLSGKGHLFNKATPSRRAFWKRQQLRLSLLRR